MPVRFVNAIRRIYISRFHFYSGHLLDSRCRLTLVLVLSLVFVKVLLIQPSTPVGTDVLIMTSCSWQQIDSSFTVVEIEKTGWQLEDDRKTIHFTPHIADSLYISMLMLVIQCCNLSDPQGRLETQGRRRCLCFKFRVQAYLCHPSPILDRLNHKLQSRFRRRHSESQRRRP